ncbi:MAG: hypothetical protein JXQ72_06850 [Anaerolineae bacterium]|nr:hypothetical protein [Anaerolineae bacterium]
MDWLKQSEEMVKMWSESQQKMMSGWLSSMKTFTAPNTAGVWHKTLETWERAVQNMLETQAQWARLWAGSVTATKGVSQETIQGVAQVKELTEQWVAFQQDLWQRWFEMARQVNLTGTPESVFQVWQESLQKAMTAQQEWVKTWMAAQQKQQPKE